MIRYNGLVLEPTGDFQVQSDDSSGSANAGLQWWHIFLIVVGVAIVGVAAVVVVVSCGWGREKATESDVFVSVKGTVVGSGMSRNGKPPYRQTIEVWANFYCYSTFDSYNSG